MGALANLGYTISDQTVGNILKRHGIPPAPERKRAVTWREFIRCRMAVLLATDFFTSEMWSRFKLTIAYLFCFIHCARQHVQSMGSLLYQWTQKMGSCALFALPIHPQMQRLIGQPGHPHPTATDRGGRQRVARRARVGLHHVSTRLVAAAFLALGPSLIGWSLIEILSRSLFALARPWAPVIAAVIPVLINIALTMRIGSFRPEFLGLGATVGLVAGFVVLFVVAHSNRKRWLDEG